CSQTAWSQSSILPGAGPPLLVIRMSGAGHAAIRAARPSSAFRSPRTTSGLCPVVVSTSAAVRFNCSASRPLINTRQPSCANASAQALPRPRDEAQIIALRPAIPKSITLLPVIANGVGVLSVRCPCAGEVSAVHTQQLGDVPTRFGIGSIGKIALALTFGQLFHLKAITRAGRIEARMQVDAFTRFEITLVLRTHHGVVLRLDDVIDARH